ncbi:MAG: 3-isopropylmalate dehydratase small subunit, partial [Rhodobacterales bacterium]|nr:3-isopropylmalate dehydratase small subunit [Rhodobacterales bacterium]MDX5389021.1 3-isopropylmalate dehydratase small subunit [Rhodobacterales bacterium]MDX5488710.1 3-isopropylmalate dehydratase small subunit [Rhodobacterales bacterium]
TWNPGLSREGPGLLLRDIEARDPQVMAAAQIIAATAPDAILLTAFDWDLDGRALSAFAALLDFGIRCVISTSFADIFFNNCFKNGILPIVLPQEQVDILMKDAEKGANARIEVDLEAQTITSSDGEVFTFQVDAFKKHCLLNGLDDIGLTLEKAASIETYESKMAAQRPWV